MEDIRQGAKVLYSNSIGKRSIGYAIAIAGEYLWIAHTRKEAFERIGATILLSEVIKIEK